MSISIGAGALILHTIKFNEELIERALSFFISVPASFACPAYRINLIDEYYARGVLAGIGKEFPHL
jgi:hypothetical protein